MNRICLAAVMCFGFPVAATADVPQLPVSADRCAITYALTRILPDGCPTPTGPGLHRSISGGEGKISDKEKGYFIRFDFASDRLTKEYQDHLSALSDVLHSDKLKTLCIKLVGHTDATGPIPVNQALSERRAASVKAFMVGHMKIGTSRVVTEGLGESQTLPNLPKTDALNRRVEILARQGKDGACTG